MHHFEEHRMTIEHTVGTYLQACCTPDVNHRTELVRSVWNANGRLSDPPMEAVGFDAIDAPASQRSLRNTPEFTNPDGSLKVNKSSPPAYSRRHRPPGTLHANSIAPARIGSS